MTDLIRQRSELLASMRTGMDALSAIKTVDLNVTELCNRACVFCPRVDPKQYPNQNLNMSLADAAMLAYRLCEIHYQNEIQIGGQGEPLLHPQILDIVMLLREALPTNRNIHLTTNADRLTTTLAHQLHAAGLDRLFISVYDSAEQKQAIKDRLAGVPLEVIWKDFFLTESESYGLGHISNRAGKLASTNPIPQQRCNLPFYSLSVDWDLDIRLCVHDWNKEFTAGSLRDNSIREVWLNPAMQEYRQMLANGQRSNSPCSACDVNGQFYGNDSYQLLESTFRYI